MLIEPYGFQTLRLRLSTAFCFYGEYGAQTILMLRLSTKRFFFFTGALPSSRQTNGWSQHRPETDLRHANPSGTPVVHVHFPRDGLIWTVWGDAIADATCMVWRFTFAQQVPCRCNLRVGTGIGVQIAALGTFDTTQQSRRKQLNMEFRDSSCAIFKVERF